MERNEVTCAPRSNVGKAALDLSDSVGTLLDSFPGRTHFLGIHGMSSFQAWRGGEVKP